MWSLLSGRGIGRKGLGFRNENVNTSLTVNAELYSTKMSKGLQKHIRYKAVQKPSSPRAMPRRTGNTAERAVWASVPPKLVNSASSPLGAC